MRKLRGKSRKRKIKAIKPETLIYILCIDVMFFFMVGVSLSKKLNKDSAPKTEIPQFESVDISHKAAVNSRELTIVGVSAEETPSQDVTKEVNHEEETETETEPEAAVAVAQTIIPAPAPTPKYNLSLTQSDKDLIMAVAISEVGETGSEEEIRGVMASILRRVQYYGSSVTEEVSKPKQFSCYQNGVVYCYKGNAVKYLNSLKEDDTINGILIIDGEAVSGRTVYNRLVRLLDETIQDGAPETREKLEASAENYGKNYSGEDTMFFAENSYYAKTLASTYPVQAKGETTTFYWYPIP